MPSRRIVWSIAVLEQDSFGCARKIIILAISERPHERAECNGAERERNGNKEKVIRHWAFCTASAYVEIPRAGASARGSSRASRLCSRMALAITSSEEADIATAATNGVTCPRIATGTATAL